MNKISITLGPVTESISNQLSTINIPTENVEAIAKYHESINLLYLSGILTDSEADRAYSRLLKYILRQIDYYNKPEVKS